MDNASSVREFSAVLSRPVRNTASTASGSMWRSPDAPEAAELTFGFPAPDLLPTTELQTAVEGVLAADGPQALQYGGGEYRRALTDKLRAYERHHGVTLEEYGLTVVNGATAAVDLIGQLALDPGDTVVAGAPTYMGALNALHNYDVTLEGIPVDSDGLDVGVLEERLTHRDRAGKALPKLVYVVPNYQNPTGWSLSRDRRQRLIELANEYDLMIVEDDAYGPLGFGSATPPSLLELDTEHRVLRLGTVSKTVAPGVRTGWIAGPDPLIETIERLDIGGSHSFVRGVLSYYLNQIDLATTLGELQAVYERRRDHMLEALARELPASVSWSTPAGGFFVWVEAPPAVDTEAMLESAADNGVLYLPGQRFVPGTGAENCLRLSFSHADPETITAGVTALGETLEAHLN